MLSLLSEENPWKNKLDILFKYTMRMLFYLLQLFVYIAIRAVRSNFVMIIQYLQIK